MVIDVKFIYQDKDDRTREQHRLFVHPILYQNRFYTKEHSGEIDISAYGEAMLIR